MRIFFRVFFVLMFLIAREKSFSQVVLNGTETDTIISQINGVTYPLKIALPGSYSNSDKNYPVVYMLDAYSSFGMMTEMQRLLAFDKELPEVIIIGISSKGNSKDFIFNRARDFTPTSIPTDEILEDIQIMTPASGGADKFLEFIGKELIPFVESKFRCIKNDRTLVGHSYGGLFSFYTLFTQPEVFNRYVIISPAVFWDNELIQKKEKEYFAENKTLDAVVYTVVGSAESSYMIEPWKRLTESIHKHNYDGLRFINKIAEGETHYTIMPFIVTHGLISVFKNDLKK
jgi:predicted alpha/beta superfamily hydrolase